MVKPPAYALSRMSGRPSQWADPRPKGGPPMSIPTTIRRLLGAVRADRGATAAEYALIASLVAVVIVLAVLFLGTNLLDLFDNAGSSYADAT